MNINSNALLDRIEVTFFSILTSCLSEVDHIQGHSIRMVKKQKYNLSCEEADASLETKDISEIKLHVNWTSFSQVIVTIIIWMILGFAAGFLIGMIQPK